MSAGPEEIARAVAALRAGGLVAFPTETVYGLGALALREDAVRRVFLMKGRPGNNPLIVHVSGDEMARTLTTLWNDDAAALARAFWPGPLTIVVERAHSVPAIVAGGGPTVAIRCPAHPLTLALIETLGEPIVGPSANRSGFVSPTSAAHVEDEFAPEIARGELMVLDGGACRAGIESTVVSLVGDAAQVLRPGVISASEIERVLRRPVSERDGRDTADTVGATPLASPGRMESHYAPRTPIVMVARGDIATVLAREPGRRGSAVLAIRGFDLAALGFAGAHTVIDMPADARGYAAALYSAMRSADALSASLIVVERPPASVPDSQDAGIWRAVLDRLTRATSPRQS